MIEAEQFRHFLAEIDGATAEDLHRLKELRREIRSLGSPTTIRDFSTTAISLVASDGGNNRLRFDPFEIQIIRVVDSYGAEGCLKVVSRYSDIAQLSSEQFGPSGPVTPLGEMMSDLGYRSLQELSPMLRPREVNGQLLLSPGWVLVYRDLWEWAVLYDKFRKGYFATDTLVVVDGLLRSKIFVADSFVRLIGLIQSHVARIKREQRRSVYLVGIAKRSKVLDRYQLAMLLEDRMREPRAVYVRVSKELEELSYEWPEYTRRPEDVTDGSEKAKFVGGRLYLAKFGPRPADPIWPVDVLLGQEPEVERIMGCLKTDSEAGFPVPYYPKCVQKAHEYSALAGIDMEILQDEMLRAIMRRLNPKDVNAFEEYVLTPKDPGEARYE